MQFKDIAAIVTGGASGLGGATAVLLARLGAKVTILDLNAELGEAKAKLIGGKFLPVDVIDEVAMAAALDAASVDHGVARILVNCAGIVPAQRTVGRDFQPASLAYFSKAVAINLSGTYNAITQFAARAAAADPLGEERGVIVNTASIAAYDGQIGQAAYAASKGGIVGMTLPVARDLAQYGIRVVTIAPGIFVTPLLAGLSEQVQKSLAQQVPFPSRLGLPDEFAQLVESIIANPMLNGETIRLDGAIRMAPK